MFGNPQMGGPLGCKPPDCYPLQEVVSPLGVQWTQDRWWFRGTNYTAPSMLPAASNATSLPAGGPVTFEIACHGDYTSIMTSDPAKVTVPGSLMDACPSNGGGPGLYHIQSATNTFDPTELGGCALGISDTTELAEVTMENIVIFSVQPKCVWTKETAFEIPAAMPACTDEFCICSWYWSPKVDLPNTYMTGFYCKVTNAKSTTKWNAPQRAAYCADGASKCTAGAKTPMFFNNIPNNTWEWDTTIPNAKRPTYDSTWGFAGGAQNDIFTGGVNSNSSSASPAKSNSASATPSGNSASEAPLGSGGAQEASTAVTTAAEAAGNSAASPSTTSSSSGINTSPYNLGNSSGSTTSSAVSASSSSTSTSSLSISTPVLIAIIVGIMLALVAVGVCCRMEARPKASGEEEMGMLATKSKGNGKKAKSDSSDSSSGSDCE